MGKTGQLGQLTLTEPRLSWVLSVHYFISPSYPPQESMLPTLQMWKLRLKKAIEAYPRPQS